ncbi:hypothetical protein, partial [Hyphomonas sp.]|uniref:hypothetical protein n=1 Tax=Hyphomonas sp. TaxID=87 RepID=UPI003297155B
PVFHNSKSTCDVADTGHMEPITAHAINSRARQKPGAEGKMLIAGAKERTGRMGTLYRKKKGKACNET